MFKIIMKKALRIFKKVMIGFLIIFFIFLLGSGILALKYYKVFEDTYKKALAGKESLILAEEKIKGKKFKEAKNILDWGVINFKGARTNLEKLTILNSLSFFKRELNFLEDLLLIGEDLAIALSQVSGFASDISQIYGTKKSFAELKEKEKEEILKKIGESESFFYRIKFNIDEAVKKFEEISQKKSLFSLKLEKEISPLREKLFNLQKLIDNFSPLVKVIPQVAGYKKEKTYLFLLENNQELRPTGGFIGTYGILKLKNGEITYFRTDNIYNLDGPAEEFLKVKPPWPLEKYLENPYWFMRDSNWSPDFPTSAEKALWFYKAEGGKEEIDGVIAITPKLISDLLVLTGPIRVEGLFLTDENFADQLIERVEVEYYKLGIPESQRKEIIGKLAEEIKKRLFALPLSEWSKIFEVFVKNLEEKHFLIYLRDKEAYELIKKKEWNGELKEYKGDFLMVVDANLGSLKTDSVVERSIRYEIDAFKKPIRARVTLNYKNLGFFSWKTTRYRTYTRIYIPKGSKLIRVEGAMENDKIKDPQRRKGKVEVGEEKGKTFFGAFISIEPQESRNLIFEYELPENISKILEQNYYSLYIQKQPGLLSPPLTINLKFDKNIKSAFPGEKKEEWYDNLYKIHFNLLKDREFIIQF